jgi:hypothetical protein
MKKDNSPLIVAVFLVIGGLLSGASFFADKTGVVSVAAAHRNASFLISTAQGAVNTATLFGARAIPPVSAVSGESAPDPRLLFSATLGTVKDPGLSVSSSSSH